jgi:acetyl-CoA C-acetyltransferase
MLIVFAMNKIQHTLICEAKRSPVGSFMGSLSSLTAPKIAAEVVRGVLSSGKISPSDVQELYMGCVLSAGVGQAPARQAAIFAGLPNTTPCTTVSKVCGSGLKAVMLAHNSIQSGEADCLIAGGMESMSQAPYLLAKMREGLRLGHGELVDSMIKDGLWDVYNNSHMGNSAELCAREHKISRTEQDDYAASSYKKAQHAIQSGLFKNEIVPIEIKTKKGSSFFSDDEEPFKTDLAKFPSLRPVFEKEGTITAANASTINDGASALLICSDSFAQKKGLKPLARIVAQEQAAQQPEWFTTAPAKSIEILLQKAELKVDDIDLWEINEAFAAVAIVNQRLLKIAPEKLNTRGGAVAIGHPIGASGARILTTLCHTLDQEKKKYGVASLCIGGGEAVSMLVERI